MTFLLCGRRDCTGNFHGSLGGESKPGRCGGIILFYSRIVVDYIDRYGGESVHYEAQVKELIVNNLAKVLRERK